MTKHVLFTDCRKELEAPVLQETSRVRPSLLELSSEYDK